MILPLLTPSPYPLRLLMRDDNSLIPAPLRRIWDFEAYTRQFLYTYKSFTTPKKLLRIIIDRYKRIRKTPDCSDLRYCSSLAAPNAR